MPIFEHEGKKYNVSDEHIDSFIREYPNATTIQERGGKKYRVRSADYKSFLSEQQSPGSDASRTETASTPVAAAPETPVTPTPAPEPPAPVVEQPQQPAQPQEQPLTEQDKMRMTAQLNGMMRDTQRMTEQFNTRMADMQEYVEKGMLSGGQTVESGFRFNPASGKMEKTFITPLGNRYADKGTADMESFRYRQAADMSVGGQLRKARQRLQDVEQRLDERGRELLEEHESNQPGGFARFVRDMGKAMAGDRMGGATGRTPEDEVEFQTDEQYQSLRLQQRQLEEQIQQLENYRQKEQSGERFWHDFGRNTWQAIYDIDAWDFGKNALRDSQTRLQLAGKAQRGEQLSDEEANALYEMYMNDNVMQQFGDLGRGARWGDIAGGSLSFMKDFLITGGFSGITTKMPTKMATSVATRAAKKLSLDATESLGVKVAEQGLFNAVRSGGKGFVSRLVAEQGIGGTAGILTTRALGVTAEDLLIRAPLMVATVQGQNTAAEIIDTKLGPVIYDEEAGELRFADDTSWGEAVWETGADKVIENFSEMWGAHLPGMADVTKAFGARNLTAAILRSTRPGAGTVMSKTAEFLNRAGINGYLGEVGEEYYGQLWRTMLNLDSAKDAQGNNLFGSGEFHGDIWGGMALSIGLTGGGTMAVNYAGEGVERGLNAARYKHLMHQLGKSDVRASEMLTPEVWEGMRLVIDASDNADMGNLAAQVMADTEMTDEQKTAVMDYMERTMIVRGHNLGEYVRRRNGETPNPDADEIDQSYIDGYNSSSAQEMNDAKNLYDVQRAKLQKVLNDDGLLVYIDNRPLFALKHMTWNSEERNALLDYINAKQVYEGMMQRVRDDIDGRIEQSNTMIDARVNSHSGMIQGATMKQDDRKVYVVRGYVAPYEDGTGVDLSASDESIIVRDAETGKLEQVSPDAILSVDEAQDPAEQKEIAAQTIREQYAREAADKIDGVASFNPGDTYTVTGEDGQQAQVTIAANEQGVVDNGDGTVNVTDGTNVFPMQKDLIQEQVDAQNLQRVTEFELQREAENAAAEQAQWEANKPQYTLNDRVTLQDENGNVYHGQIADHIEADDVFVVDVDSPIDGKYAPSLTREQLDGMVVEYNGNAVKKPTVRTTPQAEVAPEAPVEQPVQSEAAEAPVTPATETTETQAVETAPAVTEEAAAPQVSALERIPKDEQGQPLYEQADSDTAFDAIMEQADGDEAMAQSVAAAMLADKEAELKKIEKAKPKGGVSVAEKIAAERERKAAVEQAKQNVAIWKRIADTPARRKAAIEAERRRQAEEAAAQRRAEEERLKAEREEQERIKREALNGVPDIVNDTPQNARARGYRRVNGYKIDRQEPVQTLPGKEVQVKFSDDTTTKGNVVLIDASQLQPSHLGGQRNPLHFIDEAQPKERNDGVSVMSAEKIAGRIRPEEITSSVTAFTGAPTVNARGEVIQGNNRSAALREMWRSYPEQAALYKQYLKDHAAEFGLNAADIDAMQQPVLVNMLDVTDDDAITLGQFVAQDTESGGVERIKPKNAVHKMGKDMRSFVNILLRSSDDEVSFAELLDSNGAEVLKWMNHRGYITPTQHRSAFDSKGNLTGEAKNDIKGIMYQSIFKGGSTLLEEMFGQMPAKAQKAILATAWRDYDSPNSERKIEEIQNSIMAYSDLMLYDDFAKAKNFKEARQAVENWKRQYQIDDATGESYLPTDKFSNFALHLATMYKGESQNLIQGTFNRLYDLIQGTQEATIFDQQPDNTPRSLVEAIKEELNIDYNGKQRSNVLAGDSSASQRGEQGSSGTPASGERVPDRTAASDNTGGTDGDSGRSGTPGEIGSNQSQEEVPSRSAARVQEAQERLSDDEVDALMSLMESAAVETPILELNPQNWLEQFGEDGMVNTPIARVKMGANQIAKLFEKGRSEQFGMIKPTLETPLVVIEVPSEASNGDTERPTSLLYVKTFLGKNGEKIYYFKSVTVSKEGYEVNISSHYDRPKRIKEALKNGKLLYRFDGGAQTEHRPADVSVTTSQEGVQGTSASKGSDNSSNTSELGGENAEEMEEKPFAVQQSKRGDVELYRARKRNGGVTTTRVVAIRNGQEVGLATRRMPMPDGLVAVDIPEGVEILGIQELREGDDGRIAATVVVRYGEGVIEKAESRMMTPEQAAQESELGGKIAAAEAEVNRNPTEGQKEAGNYRKGHVQIGTFNVTIENPQGSVRSGTDANGNAWSVTMNNTYGYIRGTEGVDGDHIDVFLSNEIDDWNGRRVFVIDQYNEDGTFDEHKVMLGFNDADEAKADYLRNYSEGWADNRRIDCTSVNIEDFEKWIDSSHRKTKAFADYKGVKKETSQLEQSQHATDGYTVEPAQYTTKRGKVLDMQLVKFDRELSKEEQSSARELAKGLKGWFSKEHGGFLMRSEEDARSLIDAVMDESGEQLADAAPVSLADTRKVSDPAPKQIDVIGLMEEIKEKGEAKLSDHVIEETAQNETEIAQETPKSEQEAKPAVNPSGNKLVTDERYEELKRRMRAKLGQLNVGIDPEVLAIGTEMAVYHIEKGARKFADYAKAMIADLGDVIRPYLKSFYNGARDLPEVIDSGLADEMTAYDEVRTFDTANFDKGHADPFATAETVVAEQELGRQAEAAKQQIITQRNDERRKEDEQTAADTEAVAGQAEVVASQAESDLETARDERQVNAIVEKIDKQVDEVNKQLALLGYYEAEQNDKDYNEAYGYMRNAEKKAVKDANNLAKRLIKDLHIDPATLVDSKGKKLRGYAQANIAPAGGEVTITLPLEQGRELKMYIYLEPTSARRGEDYRVTGLGDNLYIRDIMYRVENPSASGYERYGSNQWMSRDDAADYAHVLQLLRSEAKRYLPAVSTESAVSEQEKPAKQKKAKKNSVSSPIQQSLFDGLFGEEAEQEAETTEAGQQEEFEPGDKVRLKKDGSEHQILATMRTQDLANGKAPVLDKYMFTDGTSALPDEVESVDAVRTDVEPINTNENGLQRNDAARSAGVQADSDRHEEGLQAGTASGSESKQEESQRADRSRERGSETVDRTVRPRPASAVAEPKNTRNNHSERGANHAPTSVDARIAANIKAIELAKQLIENGETATLKQMAVLRKYSGWGGLGKAFNERANYTLNGVQYWNEPTPENKRIRELLGEEAYQQAAMSANSSYYTPTYIIDTLWDIAEQMGFEGGNILEGSAGIGNILGQMPGHISERSDIHAIEIDETSGGILSLLYPDAKVDIQGFEKTRIANGSVDLAITNVPFVTGLNVEDTTGDKDLSKKFRNIHDFCIAKNVRKLREGGIGIFISSNGTLDSSKKLRDWVTSEGGADFVGAFRLNNETFGGAPVTSDIIIVRKRVNGRKSPYAIDLSAVAGERTADYDTGETRKVKGQEVPVVKHLAMDYNRYFIEHPENMAGVMRFGFEAGDTYRPTSKGLFPVRGKNQERMLADFAASFSGKEWTEEVSSTEEAAESTFVADTSADGKKIGELYVKDGKLVVANVGGYYPLEVNANKVKGHTKVECFNAYSAIKEALSAVLDYQTNNESDSGLQPLLDRLNKAYDDFVATYGHFNKNTAISFLRNDVDYPNVFSLETFEETGDKSGKKVQKFGKTDVFSKRVVEKEKEPTPTNVKDGIIASVFKYGRIDVPYIAGQLGKSADDVKREIISSGYGFENPVSRQVELSYQYLSGNVREKLRQAQENNENDIYDGNIKALQDVLPMDIPAHLIDFTLGSSWIDPKLYDDYVRERTDVDVRFTAVGGTWFMNVTGYENKEKNRAMGVVSEMFHKTVMGHTLIEAAIQNKTITVSESRRRYDGTTETITDKEATQACAAKIDEIRQDFKDWARQKMQGDADMSARMERIYNDTFNNYVPMSIPDDFVPEYFGGASHKFKMRPHQGRAIVRGTMQPLMLAHEVGTGKTFTLISTAMEMRRLGTARKPMIVVQNATVGQFVASAKELYPKAKILTLEEADRSAEGRKNFYAKIRYNDWDMIVVPQSTFEFIPDSEERQMAFIQDKIEEKMLILEKMREADPRQNNAITRQAEKEIEDLREQLAGITEEATKKRTARDVKKEAVTRQNAEVRAKEMLDRRTDDVENFDDMGIDALLIDEAHEYKHLGFATAMQRGVKGVDSSYSKKSQGVYLKTQAVLEKNNGRNVIFATGTPISNTAAEIWTFMRYLMPADTMKEYGIYYFDDFVRNFGNIQQMLEFTTSGKFKENNRFAGYVNLPELVRIWSGVSDTVLTREAGGVSDKIPAMEGGKAQDIYLPQTRALRSIMKYVKEALEEYEKMSGKEKKENSHMPLTMYGIAKAAAVDARLVQEDAEDDPNSKTNEAVRQTLRSLKETESYKGTVALFADNYQNKHSGFNLYDDIRNKLIAEGVPAEQIVIIRSGMTVKKKLEIFDKVNRGEIRVILGSTFTLGTGVNIQERLHTLIHLDAPNRPMDYTQRNGRILRQGNLHKSMGKPVRILRFGVEDSLDVTAYQRLKTKGAIADSIMNGKEMMTNSMTNRVLEEEEDVFGDTVAQLSGSEYAMLKNNAEKNVRKYESRRKQWEMDQTYIHNAKPKFKALIAQAEKTAKEQREYLSKVREAFPDGKFTEIKAGNKTFTSVDGMADYFKDHNKGINEASKQIKEGKANPGQTRTLSIQLGGFTFVVQTTLTTETARGSGQLFSEVHRNMVYSCPALGLSEVPVHQSLLRNAVDDIVNNVITGRDFSERAEMAERIAAHNRSELEQIEKREGVPFEFAKELEEARRQLQEYTEAMRKEMEEKEAKYAAMDASVEAAGNLTIDEDDDVLMREDDTLFRIRESEPPTKTGIGYKVFVLRDGKLYPPMVANPGGAETPVGVWLDADAAPIAGQSKTGRNQVKAGGKGTQGGSGRLAYRPGWHLGEIPYALQFNRNDEAGNRELFPANFVWAEVEYADDVNYQDEAMSYGMNKNGKFQHSLAGVPRVPENGSYRYRTNPNPETDPWIITGAMKVNRLLTPTEVDEMVEKAGREPQRRQEGAVSDAEIKNLNAQYELADKMAAAESRASRKDMAKRVEELAKKLHLDNVEIVTSTSGLQGKKARAKGFYTKSTGKITIVLPNNRNLDDAVQTLLHEAVAHYGLRQLFGKEFDTFLDNVFNNASDEVRRRIVELSKKHNWDFRKATEEYLAGLAESTDFEQARQTSWWQKIKDFFVEMLGKIGFRGVTLTDNELRYVLWRSYENLKGESGVFAEAADIAKQNELGVGEFAEADDELFRDGDPEVHLRTLDRYRYEQRVRSGMFQSMEALQDSMLSLKEAMQAVLGKKTKIEEVEGFENAYLGENRLSSVNKAEADAFAQLLFKPMLDAVAKLAKTKAQREELTDYMMAKHGLERNRVMARRDAVRQSEEEFKDELRAAQKAADNDPLDAKAQADLDDVKQRMADREEELYMENRSRDYAGLTALTGYEDVVDAEAEAQQMVADYEAANDTAELWEKVNAVSKAILQKSYDCGMMSKEVFDSISAMYEFYIPLRGFDETTSAEAYAYLNDRHSAFNAPIKKAQGRTSKADDPFANLQSMAESAITQGNRNKLVKQRFLNFALNHPSDLYSISDLWLQYDDVADEWRPVFPDNIELDESPDEVERKMLEFEEHMKQLAEAEPDKYKRGKDAVNIPYRVVESRDLRQHQVVVKRGGRDYVITINGNPRAAQALNGQTNPDNDMSGAIGAVLRAGEKINRQLSAFYTTRNPDFIVSNFLRDMLYTNSMTWIKESPTYALRFHRNYARVNPVRMKILLAKYRNGTLDMSDRTERMFRQFMLNGGETGYANIRDIEQHKNDIRRELKKLAGGKISVRKAWSLLGERFDELNRAVENCARFAAFVTSREMGRSLDRSIYDAKEISVNFNKKGSGAKFFDKAGQTKAGNAAALVSGLGRSGYVFWNAAIQGTANFGRAAKRHPAKALTGVAAMFLLGALIAYLGGSGDDDDDKNAYYNLPEYVRRSNILFRVGDSWVSIPLPIEYRAVYGMGELMVSAMSGKEHLTGGELAEAIAGQMTQILPIDFLEGGGGLNAFVPSAAKPLWEAFVVEKSWTGMPIYKNTPYNKEMPEWTKAYSSANKYIVGLAAALNEATGGDPYTKGAIDFNPAKVEYMLNGYFGGVFGTIDKLSKTGETIFGDREYDPRSILLVNRVLKAGDERTEFRAVNNEYFRLKEEHDRLKARLRHYEEDTDNGVFDYAEKIDFLYNSPEYERYEIFEYYRPDLDELYDELKEAHSYGDKDWVKEVEAEMNDLKKEMIQEMNTTRKRK